MDAEATAKGELYLIPPAAARKKSNPRRATFRDQGLAESPAGLIIAPLGCNGKDRVLPWDNEENEKTAE
jgi:hypothetical protein